MCIVSRPSFASRAFSDGLDWAAAALKYFCQVLVLLFFIWSVEQRRRNYIIRGRQDARRISIEDKADDDAACCAASSERHADSHGKGKCGQCRGASAAHYAKFRLLAVGKARERQ